MAAPIPFESSKAKHIARQQLREARKITLEKVIYLTVTI